MKKKRFSVEQITSVLQQVAGGYRSATCAAEVGHLRVPLLLEKVYGRMLPSEARELKQLPDEVRCSSSCS